MARKSLVLLILAFCFMACEDFNRPLKPWIDEQYELMKKVWDVSVSPQAAEVSQDKTRQFHAQVNVRADADQSVKWRVFGNADHATTIDEDTGLLTVGGNEPLGTALTVTATSVFDPGKSAAVTVTVRAPYTVILDPAGGMFLGPVPGSVNTHSVGAGESLSAPADPMPPTPGFVFAGWYTQPSGGSRVSFPYTPAQSSQVTLYARWKYDVTGSDDWKAAINDINQITQTAPGSYLIDIGANSFFVPKCGTPSNSIIEHGVNLTITGSGTITLNPSSGNIPGSILGFDSNVCVTLDGPVLKGPPVNPSNTLNGIALVTITSGSTFVLQSGGIKDNGDCNINGSGGVFVDNGGTFTMTGGTITGNIARNGGGVYVDNGGTFAMSGGTITGNTAGAAGGGVYVDTGGTFTLTASASQNSVSGNTSPGNSNVSSAVGSTITVNAMTVSGW